jgi:hypothetical protein
MQVWLRTLLGLFIQLAAYAERLPAPKHEDYLAAFLKKYPTANKAAHFAANLIDPAEWYASDDPKKNTVKCCQICGISESSARTPYRNILTPGYGTMGHIYTK